MVCAAGRLSLARASKLGFSSLFKPTSAPLLPVRLFCSISVKRLGPLRQPPFPSLFTSSPSTTFHHRFISVISPAASVMPSSSKRKKAALDTAAGAAPAVEKGGLPSTPNPKQPPTSRRNRSISTAAAVADPVLAEAPPAAAVEIEEEEEQVVTVVTKRRRRKKSAPSSTAATTIDVSTPAVNSTDDAIEEEKEEEVEVVVKKTKTSTRKKREPDPLPCMEPTPELLQSLSSYTPPPRPVPNFGYACLCMDLRELKPPVFTSRDCIKRTLDERGLPYLGELCLANCRDLAKVIQWNHEHGIRFFRMSSVLWPWMGTFQFEELPQADEIAAALRFAGDLARRYDQRLTFHPSHFVKLGGVDEALTAKSLAELEAHSKILELMGYDVASPENKINIHVGGVYSALGDKRATMERWASNYRKLSPSCAARVTVENDDVASAFSLEDLLYLHELCGVPLVFDFHHHRFCPGNLSEVDALKAAMATWPPGVRPVVHWSESQAGRKPHAHSDYVRGPIFLHGFEKEVDVMIESKCKERALLAYRDGLPIPEAPISEVDVLLPQEAEMAMKFV